MSGLDRLKRQLVAAATQSKPRVPDAGWLLWRTFVALHNARTVTMAGPQAVGHGAIEAYARVVRLPFSLEHVEILRAMDDAWLKSVRAKGGVSSNVSTPSTSTQEMTPALFDAVFG